MKNEYNNEVDALYIRIQDKEVFRTQEIEEDVNVDLDEKGAMIGLEIIVAVIASLSPLGAGLITEEQFATWERRRPRRLGYGQWRKEPHACR